MGKHYSFEAENDHEALLAIMVHLNREGVGNAIDALIERLDALDGDPDLEDSEAGETAVDDRGRWLPEEKMGDYTHIWHVDDAEPDDDGKGDVSWPEWHTRGRLKLQRDHEPIRAGVDGNIVGEDDEDDDPREANGDEHDTGDAEDEELSEVGNYWARYWNAEAAGCPISDPTERGGEGESGGLCPHYGIDQTAIVGEGEAFHDLNGIRLIHVPLAGNDL